MVRWERWSPTAPQLRRLGESYEKTRFPTVEMRRALANELGVTPRKIQVWFQNRRQREKLPMVAAVPVDNNVLQNLWALVPSANPASISIMSGFPEVLHVNAMMCLHEIIVRIGKNVAVSQRAVSKLATHLCVSELFVRMCLTIQWQSLAHAVV